MKAAVTLRNCGLQKTMLSTTSAHRTARSKPLHQLVPLTAQQNHQTHQQTQFSPNDTQQKLDPVIGYELHRYSWLDEPCHSPR